jgi:GTP cyclohydrolase I
VSGVESALDHLVKFSARHDLTEGFRLRMEVTVAATSLCPCSKEISKYGAHNQRSHITIGADLLEPMAIEELVAVAERAASCEVYGLLKRGDEKFVTERAYDNPKFVEDLVRDIASSLNAESRLCGYTVQAENFESIHNHSAYARITRNAMRA